MPENQESKTLIETSKEVETKKESTTLDTFSSVKNHPLVQDQMKIYKPKYPDIEKNMTDYLQKNPQKTEGINKLLNNPNLDDAKKTKIITTMIDASMKEMPVFSVAEKKDNQKPQEIDNKKVEQKQVVNTEEQVVNTEEQKKVEQKQVVNTEEQVVNTEEQKKTIEKVQTTTEKVQTTTETIQINEKLEQINKMIEEIDGKFNDLLKDPKNQNLATELNSDNYKNNYKEVAEDFKNTAKDLRNKGVSEENIDKLIKFRTAEKIIKSSKDFQNEQTNDFLLNFKKLENELNIPDASRDSFSSKNITETSAQIFNPDTGNQNLIDTVASNQKAHADKVQELFLAPKTIHDLDQIYGHFFPENHKIYLQIQEKQTQKTQLNQKETLFLQDYQKQLETQKSSYEQISANTMEKSVILGPIMGLADYMNMDIGNNFEFNKSNDIQIQNNRLSITGRVENQAFTLVTHLDKASKLETSDYLHPIGNNLFELDKNHTQTTPYILPGQQEIWATITDKFSQLQTELLSQGLTPDQYQETLQKGLCEQIKTLYGQKELVQARMEKQISKDIANQATLDMLNDSFFHGKYEYGKSISVSENPELFNFVKDFDKTLEAASSDEIRNWTTSLSQLKLILERAEIGESKKNNTEIFRSFNKDIVVNTKDSMSRKDHKRPTLFSFFSCLKNPKTKTLELDEFSKLIEENNQSQPNPNRYPTIQKQWNDLQHQIQQENNNKKTEHEQKEADRELNESLSNI